VGLGIDAAAILPLLDELTSSSSSAASALASLEPSALASLEAPLEASSEAPSAAAEAFRVLSAAILDQHSVWWAIASPLFALSVGPYLLFLRNLWRAPTATAGAYHVLTIVYFCKHHLSCFKASVLPLKRPVNCRK
jgi:hypothetical protein